MSITRLEVILASTNVHKIREFRAMLKENQTLDIRSLTDFPDYLPPEEIGKTIEENAVLKAMHGATALGRWVIADDTGLVVPALGGIPGVRSARFAGNDASDLDNRKKLLEHMHHLLDDDRCAYFECCIVLASPQGVKRIARGSCEGSILREERGGGGFGYDSLFVKHGYSKSFAELEEALKNRISHRRKAIDKLAVILESLSELSP